MMWNMHLGLRQLLAFTAALGVLFFFKTAAAQPMGVSPPETDVGYPFSQISEDDWKTDNPLVPYKERRHRWGALVSVGYSNYSPEDYAPDFVTNTTYSDFYGNVESPMIELAFSAKLNVSFFSLSLDAGAGHMQNTGHLDSDDTQASLSLTPVRVGGTLALDGIFGEPYVVPYASVGAYTVFYTEALASQKVEGRTTPALYYAAGLRFQLDWVDREAHESALTDFGLENTYAFVEGRHFSPSGDLVPDLSSPTDTPIMFDAGLMMEF
jgi:hypothetical protein